MTGGTIENSRAMWGAGVAVEAGDFDMSGGTIKDNHAAGLTIGGHGGGLLAVLNESRRPGAIININISDTARIEGNTSNNQGGGVLLWSTIADAGTITFEMTGGAITGNTARTLGGGMAIFYSNASTVTPGPTTVTFAATGGEITDNIAGNNGGGIYLFDMNEHNLINRELSPTEIRRLREFSISPAVIFHGNTAGNGSFRPPLNRQDTNIRGYGMSASIESHQAHLFNNYDINFTFDPTIEISATDAVDANNVTVTTTPTDVTSNGATGESDSGNIYIQLTPDTNFTIYDEDIVVDFGAAWNGWSHSLIDNENGTFTVVLSPPPVLHFTVNIWHMINGANPVLTATPFAMPFDDLLAMLESNSTAHDFEGLLFNIGSMADHSFDLSGSRYEITTTDEF